MILPPPTGLAYDAVNGKLLWDEVLGADSYQIDAKLANSSTWTISRIVQNNECAFNEPIGTYDATVKTGNSGEWGPKSQIYTFVVV